MSTNLANFCHNDNHVNDYSLLIVVDERQIVTPAGDDRLLPAGPIIAPRRPG